MLRRLRLTRKLTSLGLLALLMARLSMALYFGQTTPIIATAEREDSGIAPLRTLQEVVRLTPQHRGLSAGMPGSTATLEVRRPETRDARRATRWTGSRPVLTSCAWASGPNASGARCPRSRRSRSASSNRPKARPGTPR